MELGINLVTPARYRDATASGGSCVMVGSMALIDEIFKGNLRPVSSWASARDDP